ncbi:MAG: hypothetical protein M3Q03_13200 [Chloroflexota bacterium]|nr:hypothetical protein [Chloroflexota bacterium]
MNPEPTPDRLWLIGTAEWGRDLLQVGDGDDSRVGLRGKRSDRLTIWYLYCVR